MRGEKKNMLLELLSNNKIVKIPDDKNKQDYEYDNNAVNVRLLLSGNKYLAGYYDLNIDSSVPKWKYVDRGKSIEVQLYKDSELILPDGHVLSESAVNRLRNELFSQMTPPGEHLKSLSMLKLIENNQSVIDTVDILTNDVNNMNCITKMYWAMRFSIMRGDYDILERLKAWYRVHNFFKDNDSSKIWFFITSEPDTNFFEEIRELGFTEFDIRTMLKQGTILNKYPLKLYNYKSGYLILWNEFEFFVWVYLTLDLGEIFFSHGLTLRDSVLSLWAEFDIRSAVEERKLYKGGF